VFGTDDVDVDATAATNRVLAQEPDGPTGCMSPSPRERGCRAIPIPDLVRRERAMRSYEAYARIVYKVAPHVPEKTHARGTLHIPARTHSHGKYTFAASVESYESYTADRKQSSRGVTTERFGPSTFTRLHMLTHARVKLGPQTRPSNSALKLAQSSKPGQRGGASHDQWPRRYRRS
jgi:hypothetical protein